LDKRAYTCCFTGHRRFRPGEAPKVQARLDEILEYLITCRGVRYFGAGGALGFDTMAAETVLRLKPRYPQIRLILVLPCPEQAKYWPAADAAVYERHKKLADRVVYIARSYYNGCMQERNRHLVDHSAWCVSYQYAAAGGAAYTVDYARKNGLALMSCINEAEKEDGQRAQS
jgi:uncharacterized phage-like protein YoqJ